MRGNIDLVSGKVIGEFAVPANETSQVKLLERDVMIQFLEIRRLQGENERLKKKIEMLKDILRS